MIHHEPVLAHEVIEMLEIKNDGAYLDATAGGGGHSRMILSRLSDRGRLVCTDRDDHAVQRLTNIFQDSRVFIRRTRFSGLDRELGMLGIHELDGVLMDLGVSMFQMKDPERGFSFDSDARLDMRMDTESPVTAWTIVNKYPQKEIEQILREYSDERLYRRIAKAIVQYRGKKTIDTCKELAAIVAKVFGRRGKIHPATRTFQALRIAVNNEIGELKRGLEISLGLLKKGGRLCVIAYHSLEDRVVKHFFREMAVKKIVNLLTKKPLPPSPEEVRRNPSSRSAKLRGVEKA